MFSSATFEPAPAVLFTAVALRYMGLDSATVRPERLWVSGERAGFPYSVWAYSQSAPGAPWQESTTVLSPDGCVYPVDVLAAR